MSGAPAGGGSRRAGRAPRDAAGRLRWEPAAGDVVQLVRPHVCGSARMAVTMVGLDVRLSCSGCGARLTMSRERARSRVADVVGRVGDAPDPGTPGG